MCIKRLGNVEINPRGLLFDGLDKELDLKLKAIIYTQSDNILKTLVTQAKKLRTLQRAFYFICEYIGINGVIMWQEKLKNIVNAGIEDAYDQCLQIKVKICWLLNFFFIIKDLISSSITKKNTAKPIVHKHFITTLLNHILQKTCPKFRILFILYIKFYINFRKTNYHIMLGEWWSNDPRPKINLSIDFFSYIEV